MDIRTRKHSAATVAAILFVALLAAAEKKTVRIDFDSDVTGAPPAFFRFEGSPGLPPEKWRSLPNASPFTGPNVGVQTSSAGEPGRFHFALSTEAENFSDGAVQVETKPAGRGLARGGVVVRYRNPLNFTAALVDFQTQTVTAISVRNGKVGALASAPIRSTEPVWRTARLEASGKTLRVFVSGQKALEVLDPDPRPGAAGLIAEAPVPVAFDDLEISIDQPASSKP